MTRKAFSPRGGGGGGGYVNKPLLVSAHSHQPGDLVT